MDSTGQTENRYKRSISNCILIGYHISIVSMLFIYDDVSDPTHIVPPMMFGILPIVIYLVDRICLLIGDSNYKRFGASSDILSLFLLSVDIGVEITSFIIMLIYRSSSFPYGIYAFVLFWSLLFKTYYVYLVTISLSLLKNDFMSKDKEVV